jgi:hypothetical protein
MFNQTWIGEPDFNDLVHKLWKYVDSDSESSPMVQFMDNLRNLKAGVYKWEKQKKQLLLAKLQKIESGIRFLFKKILAGTLSKEDLSLLEALEERKKIYLLKEEEPWRLKRMALWL